MPNWCSNSLTVRGPQDDLDAFITRSCGQVDGTVANLVHGIAAGTTYTTDVRRAFQRWFFDNFSFAGHLPIPAELRADSSPSKVDEATRAARVAAYGAADWYDWSVQNWGTKWDVHDLVVLRCEPDELRITFETAWGPPQEWLAHVSTNHPTLDFTLACHEPGAGMRCVLKVRRGELHDATEYPYDFDAEFADEPAALTPELEEYYAWWEGDEE